ncbi:MAG TPA: amidase [Magnetospirillaceae bacterium]|jgi:amidase
MTGTNAPQKPTPIFDRTPALCRLGAHALAATIRAGKASAREVMTAYLDHIERTNPPYNAIVSLRPRDALLAEADAADARMKAGERLGPLHGVPQAVKDLAATKGLRTTMGSPIFVDTVPDFDQLIVARARAAGAIIIGKTNTPEFGLGSNTYNPVHGITRNAYDTSRSAGGSSGGAAVALALRMLPVADGSDYAGSLRNPAGWNNIFGFRPSMGRVPAVPSDEIFWNHQPTEGPMGRAAIDIATLFTVQAGYDARAPLSLGRADFAYEDRLREFKPAGTRIAWLGDCGGHLPMEAGVLDVCTGALKLLEGIGCVVEPAVPNFDLERVWQAFVTLRHFGSGGKLKPLYDDPAKRALMKPEAQFEVEGFMRLTGADLYAATITRSAWYHAVLALFERYDFLALPSAQVFAFDANLHWPTEIAGRTMDSYHRWMEVVTGVTMTGCPVICVPAGFNAAGQSMGLQLVGRPRKDLATLQLAQAYEDVCPWVSAAP